MYVHNPHLHLLHGPHHIHTCHAHTRSPTRKTSSPTRSPHAPTLPLLHPHVPPTTPKRATTDPTLQSTWPHRAWVATGCATVLASLAKSITIITTTDSASPIEPFFAALLGYFLADLGTGIYHWAIDNYGDSSTPVFGSQIEAFQGHHNRPWTITKRQFANNLHALARAVALVVAPIDVVAGDAAALAFVGTCSGCIMFSQQFHAWAHGTRSRLPAVVKVAQDAGVLVSPAAHGKHHRTPYNNNYCIVSGVWNGFLDENRVFEVMEMVVFFRFGVRPRSWGEPGLDWVEETEVGSLEMGERV